MAGKDEMKPEEAIKLFEERLAIPDYKKHIPEYYNAMELAISALKMQVPKKPDKVDMQTACAECGHPTEIFYNYCPACGQAIEWGSD